MFYLLRNELEQVTIHFSPSIAIETFTVFSDPLLRIVCGSLLNLIYVLSCYVFVRSD